MLSSGFGGRTLYRFLKKGRYVQDVHSNIQRILDMQRRGKRDFDQTSELLEAFYNTLDSRGRSDFFDFIQSLLVMEPLPPTLAEPKFTIHGAIIKAWARFLPTDKLAPQLFSLMNWSDTES